MVQARIYRPAKTAMQSGKAGTRRWVLELCLKDASFIALPGEHGSTDRLRQIRLTFRSLDSAILYAKDKNLTVRVEADHVPAGTPKSYADNFRYDRVG